MDVWTADGINNDKHNFLDSSLRVPLILRYPGVLPAGRTAGFATTLDISATIVAMSGAPIPKQYQGFDLVTPLSHGLQSPRLAAVSCEYRAMAVVTPSWKLTCAPSCPCLALVLCRPAVRTFTERETHTQRERELMRVCVFVGNVQM